MASPPESFRELLPGETYGTVSLLHPPRRPYWLHALLFVFTVFTTLIVGARLQQDFVSGQAGFIADTGFFPLSWTWRAPKLLLQGIPFSAALLSILMAHEMGHFVFALRNRVYATLPFFIPAPTPIGTLGAFIQVRSRFPTRAALLDVGIAGPIAGFVVAAPLALLGLALSHFDGSLADPESMTLQYPAIFHVLHQALLHLRPATAPLEGFQLHPVAIAAWIGMLATMLNLLPGGQLDGGHILFAVNPAAHRRVTYLAAAALAVLGFFAWSGWFIWALGLLVTRKHPPVAESAVLPPSRRVLAWLALALLALTFTARPFSGSSPWEWMH